jgi:hypothetical protein
MSYNTLLINTCDVEHSTLDKWGEPTTSQTLGVKCRIEFGNKIIRNALGEAVVSAACVFFKASVVLEESDRLYFQGRWHGIQRIDRVQDSVNVHHVEAWVD